MFILNHQAQVQKTQELHHTAKIIHSVTKQYRQRSCHNGLLHIYFTYFYSQPILHAMHFLHHFTLGIYTHLGSYNRV